MHFAIAQKKNSARQTSHFETYDGANFVPFYSCKTSMTGMYSLKCTCARQTSHFETYDGATFVPFYSCKTSMTGMNSLKCTSWKKNDGNEKVFAPFGHNIFF